MKIVTQTSTNTNKKERLRESKLYGYTQRVSKFLDQYYLDGAIGLIPGGIGDTIAGLFGLLHVYFALFRLRSLPLTLAILSNVLRDIFLGMIPFYVGDVIDFFHRANRKNMILIDGFINDDETIVRDVNKRATLSAIIVIALIIAIIIMFFVLVQVIKYVGSILIT